MSRGMATSQNEDGSTRQQSVEILRWYGAEKHCLVRFPGNPIAYVKLKVNVALAESTRRSGKAA